MQWGVDVAMSGSQKGLMTPPGLGFVAAGERARAAHRRAGLRTPYWDWTARDGEVHYQKYAGTPPEHLLFGLRQALDMLVAEGLENVFRRHRLLAEAVRRAVAVWSERQGVRLQHRRAGRALRHRDHHPDGEGPRSRRRCSPTATASAASCSARASASCTARRSASPIWATSMRRWCWASLGVVEIGLAALGIPHRKGGVQAAIDWLAETSSHDLGTPDLDPPCFRRKGCPLRRPMALPSPAFCGV